MKKSPLYSNHNKISRKLYMQSKLHIIYINRVSNKIMTIIHPNPDPDATAL